VGFDSGDNFFLGMLTAAGFEPQPFVAPQLTRLTTTPTESEFYVLEDCCEGKWWLEWLLGANAEELPAGIAAQGQTIELATPLKIRVDEELGGEPANLMFTVMNELVADVGTADLIERLAPGVVQRLPVTVFGHAGPFEVVNILSIKSRDDSALSNCVRSQSRRGLSSDRVLGETVPPDYRIFRLAENRRRIVVHRLVKEGLEQAGLSGVGLTPLTATS
jgi:hypothetical protein